MKQMKTLTMGGITYETNDAKARRDIAVNCAPAIDDTAAGDNIVVSDASNRQVIGLRMFGQTKQATTTGKNLLDFPDELGSMKGVTFTVNEDRSVTASGTPTDIFAIPLYGEYAVPLAFPAGTYMCSGGVDESHYLRIRIHSADGTLKTQKYNYGPDKEFVLEEGDLISVALYFSALDTVNKITFYPMIRLASIEDGTYEPYTGATPSPNPEYPQVMVNTDNPMIGIYGTNLIDVSKLELGSNTSLVLSANNYMITTIGGSTKTYTHSRYDMPENLIRLLRGKRLRLSADSITKTVSDSHGYTQLNVDCENGKSVYPYIYDEKLNHEFVMPEDVISVRVGVYTNNSSNLLDMDNTVVVTGLRLTLVESSGYEPYVPVQYFEVPRTLRGIPVTTDYNYTDASDVKTVCDEVDFERGLYIQRVRTASLMDYMDHCTPGSNTQYSDTILRFDIGNVLGTKKNTPMVCDRFIYKFAHDADANLVRTDELISTHSVNDIVSVFIDKNRLATPDVDGFAAWLIDNPVEIAYILSTPVEIPLTKDELAAFAKLHTNRTNTTVISDAGTSMELKYSVDTKTYINNVVADLLAANGIGGV